MNAVPGNADTGSAAVRQTALRNAFGNLTAKRDAIDQRQVRQRDANVFTLALNEKPTWCAPERGVAVRLEFPPCIRNRADERQRCNLMLVAFAQFIREPQAAERDGLRAGVEDFDIVILARAADSPSIR